MPIYSRRTLRQRLGQDILHDTLVGTTTGSWGTQAGSYNIVDSTKADPTASGEQLYHRQWLRLLGSAGFLQDIRVGSFNTGSGAFVGAQTLATTVFSGMPYEVHGLISPEDKDRTLDAVIRHTRVMNEARLGTVEDAHIYSISSDILDVTRVRYFSDPADSLNLGVHEVDWFELVKRDNNLWQLRIEPALPASYELVLNAITAATLGADDLATVYFPSDEHIIWGAAARCYWMAERAAPGQEAGRYAQERQRAAREYTRLSLRFTPKLARKVQLEEWW